MKNIKSLTFGAVAALTAFSPLLSLAPAVYAYEKSETVYEKLTESGAVSSLKITEQLTNSEKSDIIEDYTTLKNLENLNGYETYTTDGNSVSWNANGSNIFYTGTTDQTSPISVSVTYRLNGEEKSLDEILGQSGNVEIDFHFENSDSHTVLVNGSYESLKTPFVIALSTILNSKNASNIEVENGKAVSNGDSYVLAAVAAPGLSDSLNLDEDLDDIKIAFAATDFSLPDIYMVATPKLLDSADLSVFDELDSLYSSMDELSAGSDQLVDGANQIDSATEQVRSGLSSASDQLLSYKTALGEESLTSLTDPLISGITAKLEASKTAVAASAAQTATETVDSQSSAISAAAVSAVDSSSDQVLTSLCLASKIDAAVMGQQLSQADAAALLSAYSSNTLTPDQSQTLQTYLCSDAYKQAYATSASYQVALSALKTAASTAATSTAASVASTVASETASSVIDGIEQTLSSDDSKAEIISGVVSALKNLGVDESTIDSFIASLSGVNTYLDGVSTLTAGVRQLDHDGIDQLVNFVNGDVKTLVSRAEALTQLSKEYQPLAGSSADSSTTKFILMIDARSQE